MKTRIPKKQEPNYFVKATGTTMVLLHPDGFSYEDARRLAVKLGGIVTNRSFVIKHRLRCLFENPAAVSA